MRAALRCEMDAEDEARMDYAQLGNESDTEDDDDTGLLDDESAVNGGISSEEHGSQPEPPGNWEKQASAELGALDRDYARTIALTRVVPATAPGVTSAASTGTAFDDLSAGEATPSDDATALAPVSIDESAIPAAAPAASGGTSEGGDAGEEWSASFEDDGGFGAFETALPTAPPLESEEVATIKQAMAALDIVPPPWVRKMQHLQKIQQLQQQQAHVSEVEQAEQQWCESESRLRAHWAQQMQERAGAFNGSYLLTGATIANSSPLLPGAVLGANSLSGVRAGRKVSSHQLAAERRKNRKAKQ